LKSVGERVVDTVRAADFSAESVSPEIIKELNKKLNKERAARIAKGGAKAKANLKGRDIVAEVEGRARATPQRDLVAEVEERARAKAQKGRDLVAEVEARAKAKAEAPQRLEDAFSDIARDFGARSAAEAASFGIGGGTFSVEDKISLGDKHRSAIQSIVPRLPQAENQLRNSPDPKQRNLAKQIFGGRNPQGAESTGAVGAVDGIGAELALFTTNFKPLVEQLNSAATLLSDIRIQVDANVGPIEVVLNGASIISQFGEKVKAEILEQVGLTLQNGGYVNKNDLDP
jgi:hypothetical protein